jgi:hypothetical protein
VTIVVSYLVGLPVACCFGAALFGWVPNENLRSGLIVLLVVATLFVPGLVAYWWNYRRKPPTDLRPWV